MTRPNPRKEHGQEACAELALVDKRKDHERRTKHLADELLEGLPYRLFIEDLMGCIITVLDALHILNESGKCYGLRRCWRTHLPFAPQRVASAL